MAIVIPYARQTWVDGSGGGTPESAARLGVIEEGILDVSQAPAVRVYHSAAQTLTTAVTLALAFNSERFDQAGGAAAAHHDVTTNNSRLTCLYAGIYLIEGGAEFAANATGIRDIWIRLNGTTVLRQQSATAVSNNVHRLAVATLYSLAVNDYVELAAYQTSGGNLNVNSTANHSPEFGMVRVA